MKKYVLSSGIAMGLILIFAIREPFASNTLQRLNYEGHEAANDTYNSESAKINLPAPRGDTYNSEGEKINLPAPRGDTYNSEGEKINLPTLRSDIINSGSTKINLLAPRGDTFNSEGTKASTADGTEPRL